VAVAAVRIARFGEAEAGFLFDENLLDFLVEAL
jgi:hypothetical protein